MHFLCTTKKVLQKQSAKTNLKVLGKSCGKIDDNVMKFILQYGDGANNFLNKIEKVGAEQLL